MGRITDLLGHSGGPMGAKIEPRACRYCNYYGHTKQHCKVRKRDEEERLESELESDRTFLSAYKKSCDPEWSVWLRWFKNKRAYAIEKSGGGCMNLECNPCGECETCASMERHLKEWVNANPEPPCKYGGRYVDFQKRFTSA